MKQFKITKTGKCIYCGKRTSRKELLHTTGEKPKEEFIHARCSMMLPEKEW